LKKKIKEDKTQSLAKRRKSKDGGKKKVGAESQRRKSQKIDITKGEGERSMKIVPPTGLEGKRSLRGRGVWVHFRPEMKTGREGIRGGRD